MKALPRIIGMAVLAGSVVCGVGGDLRPAQPDPGLPTWRPPAAAAARAGTIASSTLRVGAQAPKRQAGSAPELVPVPPAVAETVTKPRPGGFVPVPLTRLREPLPENEVWLIQTVLLNPDQGTLANPGGWAAPAVKLRSERHWK